MLPVHQVCVTCPTGVYLYLGVSVVLGEAPPHHVGDPESLHPEQVEDHGVGQPELGLQHRGLTLVVQNQSQHEG